jgi:hypothetical protein
MHLLRRSVLTLAAPLLLGLAAMPAHAVTVSIAPAETTVTVGDDFYVRSVTTAFPDLKAYHLIYSFSSTIITSITVDPGDVLTVSGNPYSAFPFPDNTTPTGSIRYDAAMLTASSAGPGILGFFKFHALAIGDSPVQCETVDFRDSNNVQTLPTCVSGLVHVVGAVPVRASTWARIKVIYR